MFIPNQIFNTKICYIENNDSYCQLRVAARHKRLDEYLKNIKYKVSRENIKRRTDYRKNKIIKINMEITEMRVSIADLERLLLEKSKEREVLQKDIVNMEEDQSPYELEDIILKDEPKLFLGFSIITLKRKSDFPLCNYCRNIKRRVGYVKVEKFRDM